MAIIPKGNFQNRASSDVSTPSLPDDGSAGAYRALAEMGDTMAAVGAKIYKKNRAADQANTVNKALTSYATASANNQSQLQGQVNDEGFVGDKTYSDTYNTQDEALKESIASGISDPEARSRFLLSVESSSRTNKVSSINFETKHKKARFKANSISNDDLLATSLIEQDSDVNRKAVDNYAQSNSDLQERLSNGIINEGEFRELNEHNGKAMANAAAKSAILRGDTLEASEILGVTFLNTPEARQYIRENGLEEQANEYITSAMPPEEVIDPNAVGVHTLKNFISPAKKAAYIKQMLSGMKNQKTQARKDLAINYKNIRASIRDNSTPWVDKEIKAKQATDDITASMEALGFSPTEVEDKRLTLKTDMKVAEISDEMAMMTPSEQARHIQEIDKDLEKVGDHAGAAAALQGRKDLQVAVARLHEELKKSPGDYMYKHDPLNRQFWDAVTPDNPAGLKIAMDNTSTLQDKMGIAPNKKELTPSHISEMFASKLTDELAQPDKAAATESIVALRQELGDKLPAFLNKMVKDDKLEDDALSVVSHIKDPEVLRQSLMSITNAPLLRKDYQEKLKNEKNPRELGADRMFTKLHGNKMNNFMQLADSNEIVRNRGLKSLVMAKFYEFMRDKEVSSSNVKQAMTRAYDTTAGKMFTETTFGNSTLMLPSSAELEEPRVKATIKHMKTLARNSEVDLTKIPQINAQYDARGWDEARKQVEFKNQFSNKFQVYYQDSDGAGGVMRLGFKSSDGLRPLPLKQGEFSTSPPILEFNLEDIKSDILIENLMNEDAKRGFFDSFLDDFTTNIKGSTEKGNPIFTE